MDFLTCYSSSYYCFMVWHSTNYIWCNYILNTRKTVKVIIQTLCNAWGEREGSSKTLVLFWIIWIIMNFFARFSRVSTISISKIAVKSHKLCAKISFWYIPKIIARIFNQQGGCQRFCYVTEGGGILLTLRTVTRGEGGPNFCQKQCYVTFEWSQRYFFVHIRQKLIQ